MEKIADFIRGYDISYIDGTSRRTYCTISASAAAYSALVVSFSFVYKTVHSHRLLTSFIAFLVLFFTFFCLVSFAARLLANGRGFKVYEKKLEFSWQRFSIIFVLLATPLVVGYLYWFPGIHNLDTIDQWRQVTSFSFNDWHPALHSILIWLLSRVSESYAFVILIQNILFCYALTFMYTTLERWGIPTGLLAVVFGSIVLTPETQTFMQILHKDGAFSIAAIVLTTMIIDIYLCNGGVKRHQIIALGVLSGVTTLLRHNGFFFTVPLITVLVAMYWKRRYIRYIAPVFILTVLAIRFPIYSAFNVNYPNNAIGESVGWPMVVMGDIYVFDPMSIDDETRAFLLSYAGDNMWQEKYQPGDFDSIKWEVEENYELLNDTPLMQYISMAMRSAVKNPVIAFEAIRQLTASVWNISDEFNLYMYPNRELLEGILEYEAIISLSDYTTPGFIESYIRPPLFLPLVFVPRVLLLNIGMRLLGMIFCFAAAFPRNGRRSYILVLPSVLYCFCTMPILASPGQQRIFHFVLAISFPICILLLASKKGAEELHNQTGSMRTVPEVSNVE